MLPNASYAPLLPFLQRPSARFTPLPFPPRHKGKRVPDIDTHVSTTMQRLHEGVTICARAQGVGGGKPGSPSCRLVGYFYGSELAPMMDNASQFLGYRECVARNVMESRLAAGGRVSWL